MDTRALDNPFWSALDSIHAGLAVRAGDAAVFPADVAPFLGLAHPGAATRATLEALMQPGETRLVLGLLPEAVPEGFTLTPLETLWQMVCDVPMPACADDDIIALDATRQSDILGLTALVYPHYFRSRTTCMGRYFGIDRQGQLAAMAGERLGAPGFREISAICTHPDHLGKGLAGRLTTWLTRDTLTRGDVAFLQVSPANTRAHALYERLGYRIRAHLPFARIDRL
ncbi:GNAT family N-acetyltransferase [Lysobacter soyae]|uniref:GNAT family N-acetyltransferase n=1 Tax=Lysobacter soyae TaxID=2764185 RepID=A0ABX8WS70_9GAMM|nr:GNAT family N-acetyltransferase [Lysobacter sp. CJ11]QYR53688.1 GNAT family N-acetyltransferase [Lysobacter sp. CJ11]